MDTIFALSTARGRSALAVVRMSGPRALEVGRALAGTLPPPRQAGVRRLVHRGDAIDEALVLCFGRGRSFTGEDLVEFHVHGGAAVVRRLLEVLAGFDGLRPAEAGEFTRRAVMAGRIGLTEVEGLADLIDAETEVQRRQAMRAMTGGLAQRAAGWRRVLVQIEALLAAGIDFADEDVPEAAPAEIAARLEALVLDWRREVAGSAVAERVRDGFEVAIVGPANIGKSTLLNAIAGRDAAITSPRAGTTRDVIEVRMDLAGLPVTFLDTAGLREAGDEIEAEGIARTRRRAGEADLRLFLLEDDALPAGVEMRPGDIVVRGKADLPGREGGVSGLTGAGVDQVLGRVAAELEVRVAAAGSVTRLRQRRELERAIEALESARHLILGGGGRELVAEEMRVARQRLATLIGEVSVEEVLGEVFSRFCIGK